MNNKSILAKARIIISVLTVIVCMLIGCERKQEIYLTQLDTSKEEATTRTEGEKQEEEIVPQETEPPHIVIHVCGAVVSPGVYVLTEGSRLYQAVEMAGGFAPEAAQDYLNQAKVLSDGMKLYIPTEEEVLVAQQEGVLPDYLTEAVEEELQNSSPGLVNINTASEAELCTLTGIGTGKAKSIIAYRTENGRYEKIEDIMKVEGIKDGLFEKIKDSITV